MGGPGGVVSGREGGRTGWSGECEGGWEGPVEW